MFDAFVAERDREVEVALILFISYPVHLLPSALLLLLETSAMSDPDRGVGPSVPRTPDRHGDIADASPIRTVFESANRRFPSRRPDQDFAGSPRASKLPRSVQDSDRHHDLRSYSPVAVAGEAPMELPLHDVASFEAKMKKAKKDHAISSSIRERPRHLSSDEADAGSIYPPSFAESQFATIVRRQRKRRIFSPMDHHLEQGGRTGDEQEVAEEETPEDKKGSKEEDEQQLKIGRSGNDPLAMGRHAWEFAGWGSMSLLELSPKLYQDARQAMDARPKRDLGALRAAAIAGNAITGSVFYSLPAVLSAAGVYAPISLFVACLLIGPFRPLMLELTSALGATDSVNYAYFRNISPSSLALVAAAATALDALATGAVSASTAASYIEAEMEGHVGSIGWTAILLVVLAAVTLLGLRDSSNVALSMISLHIVTMAILIISGIVFWAKEGSGLLVENWNHADLLLNGKSVARAIFDGICIGFVGLTGFECAPSYVTRVKEGQFGKALWSLQIIVLLTEAPLMLLCIVAIPISTFTSSGGGSANVLALLAEAAGQGSSWLKILVVVDAAIVLCGGIITGIISFCGLVEALARDLMLPQFILREIPKTHAAGFSIGLFLALAMTLCATSGFSLSTLSAIFSLSFLMIMSMFALALLLIKHNRPTLARQPRNSLFMTLFALSIGLVAIAGNIALGPQALLFYCVYAGVLLAALWTASNKVNLAKLLYWTLDQNRNDWLARKVHVKAGKRLIQWIRQQRKHPVVYLTKTDELSVLIDVLSYVRKNEHTSRVILVHCYDAIEKIPSELEANYQLVDESFPTITVDLVFVEAAFTPLVVQAVAIKLGVPLSRCFISCPSSTGQIGKDTTSTLDQFGGLRVISD